MRAVLAAFLVTTLVALAAMPQMVEARCPERPACTGCGCKGGPGYRGPDGKCVGFKNLAKVCGTPPEQRCVFENAPGTGLNHDCALGLDKTTKSAAHELE
jgi:hypothetical protein